MNDSVKTSIKVFKTAWFSKHAKKANIKDKELCNAAEELMRGIWDAELGGNVFKKRLNENRHRSIVLTKTDSYWIFTYLFSKADRENISEDELKAFKKLSKDFSKLSTEQIHTQVKNEELTEICHECTNEIQK